MPKILSIEIDNTNIKIIEASRKISGQLISIINILSIKIPSGCIEDGKIINITLIKDRIEKLLLENQIKTKKAIFVIGSNAVITRKMKLPTLKRKSQTKSMIKIEFEQLISTNLDQIIIYKMIDSNEGELINESKYIVRGLSCNIFNQYHELSKMLKLKLIALETSSSCLENISKKNLSINNTNSLYRTTAFIKISTSYVVFCVIKDGIDDFSRTIKLYSDRHNIYDVDRVAESSVDVCSILNEDMARLNSEVDKNILIDEISKNIRYHCSMDKDNNIDKIYIYGDYEQKKLEEFEKYLSIGLNIDVESIKEISKIECAISDNKVNLIEYLHILLSFLSDKNDINFMTDKVYRRKIKLFISSIILFLSICILLMLSFRYESSLIETKLLNEEINNMAMFINMETNIKINDEIKSVKSDIRFLEDYKDKSIKVKEVIYNNNNVSSQILREVAILTPENTTVISIVMGKNNIQMQCKSNYVEDIIMFLGNLRDIDSVERVYIPIIKYNGAEENNYSYSVICKLEDVSLENE